MLYSTYRKTSSINDPRSGALEIDFSTRTVEIDFSTRTVLLLTLFCLCRDFWLGVA
jgi:hypothetical protein